MKHPLARSQAALLAVWLCCWLLGSSLPGGFGSAFHSLGDLLFVALSAITAWIGFQLYRNKQKILLFYMAAHIRLARKFSGPQRSAAVARSYQRTASMQQTGQILLLAGSICLLVGLYYLIF
jgi:hypothetical protein